MQKKRNTQTVIKPNKANSISNSFQKKLRSISSPEELMALARRMNEFQKTENFPDEYDDYEEETEEEEEEENEELDEPVFPTHSRSSSRGLVVKPTLPPAPVAKPEAPAYTRAPWYEHGMSDTEAMVIDLYSRGMTLRDISNFMKQTQNVDLIGSAISAITDKVYPFIKDWQARPLSPVYPILYLDGIHFKVRDAGKIVSKVAYVALGFNIQGQKEILGVWISDTEGARFWAHVLNDIKNRGVEDVLITCVDGLKGFPEAIKANFPRTEVQVCIVHQIRHTLMYISSKDRKRFAEDLRNVYTASNEELALKNLEEMEEHWPQYISYLKSWERRWPDLAPFFKYPEPIRHMIYTTNTIENLNRQFRKVTKTTQLFPSDDALIKLLWLAQANITESWKVTARNWGSIVGEFNYLFPDRIQF